MSNLDQLLNTPPDELVADLKALRDERAAIEGKESVLEQLLDMLSGQGGHVAEEIAELGAMAAIGPLKNQIFHVMRTKTEEEEPLLVPQTVFEVLRVRGNRTATLAAVRVAMGRMADAGELERPAPRNNMLFALPGTRNNLLPAVAEAFGVPQE
jgi:hypothetical protein